MASAQERLKLKRPCEVWSVKEQLCLASSVLKSGDQNWMSVSRSLKPFLEKELQRPVDWFSQKACALQYAQLLENADTPKRKKRETSETIGESIVRRLTQERIAELSQFLATQREEYQQLRNELNLLKSGNIAEDKLQKMWLNIELEEREQEQKNKTHTTWLARRQKQEGQTPQILGFNIQRKSESSESGHDTLDPNTDEEEKKNKGGRSPLLTSLLKSPSPTTQIQSQTSSAQVTSPTIASLLGSSPKIPNPPLTQTVSSQLHQLVSTAIVNATPERPSAGAPTLSMLLELPANLQRATLSNLQTHTPTTATTTNLPQQNVDLQLMQIDSQRSNIQIIEPPITPANMSTSEMIDHIDEVIPKDIMADVIDKDEMNEIIGDIEELIKGEIPDNPQVLDSGATNIIGNINQPIITAREEVKSTPETVSIADSSSTREIPLVEINSNTSNIAEIIGTVTAENKEKKAENETKTSPSEEEPKDKKSLESKELTETRKSSETTDKTINEEQSKEIENKNNSVEKETEKQESKKTSEAVKETNKPPNEEPKSSKEEEGTAKSSKDISKKTVKEETKKSTKEEEEGKKNPKEETKKITKEETKVAKEETKRISKEEIKKAPKEEAKKILKDDPKKNTKEEIKKPSKEEIKKPPREELKKNPTEEVKKPSKDDSKKPTNTEEAKKAPKEEKTPKDDKISKDDAKKTQKEDLTKKNSKEETKKSTKEEVKKNPKEESKKNVKDETKNPKEEQKRTTKEETVKKTTKEEPAKKNPKDEAAKKNPKEEQKKTTKEETRKNPKEEVTKKNSKEETKKSSKEETTKKSNKVEIKKPIADETKKSHESKKSDETKNSEETRKLTENSKHDAKDVKTTNELKETRENKSTEKCGNPEEIIQNSENHSNKNNDQEKIEANTTKQDQNATTEILSISSNDTLINEDTEKSQDISLILEEEDTPANQEKRKDSHEEKTSTKDNKQVKDNDVEEHHQKSPDNVKIENFKRDDTKDSSDGTSNTELLEADMKDFDDDDDDDEDVDDEQMKIDDKEKISKFIPIEIKKEDDIGIREENEVPDEMRSETIKCTKELKDEIDEKKIHLDDSAIIRKEQSQFSGSVSELDEEESSLSKLSGGRVMKTYSKRQAIAIDSEPEMESSEGADYRAWKKAVMLVYNRLATHKYASAFLRPITEDQAPGYHSIIFRPMDLSTIKKNIDNGTIRSTRHFQRDVMLMFQNAIMYNKHDTFVYKMAITMQEECLQHMQILVQVTGEVSFRRETRTAASTSNESSETISKRKRSHITPSPHDTDNSRGKKRRKSEND